MMNSIELGRLLIENVPFAIDPKDETKFVLTNRESFFENIVKVNEQSILDYIELRSTHPDMKIIDCIRKVLYTSRGAFNWCYEYCDKNYPGAQLNRDGDRLDDYLMVYLTEILYGGVYRPVDVKTVIIYSTAKEIAETIKRSGDRELSMVLLSHRVTTERIASRMGIINLDDTIAESVPKFIGETLHNLTLSNTKEEMKECEQRIEAISEMIISHNFRDITVMAELMQSLIAAQSFIHYIIHFDMKPTDELVMEFFDNPRKFLMNFDDEEGGDNK